MSIKSEFTKEGLQIYLSICKIIIKLYHQNVKNPTILDKFIKSNIFNEFIIDIKPHISDI